MMKIAVTGANGFVGSNLANYFQQLGNEVVAIVRTGSDTSLLNSAITINYVNYQSESDLLRALEGVEVLIHNAGRTRTLTFEEMISANVVTTRKVVDAVNQTQSCQHFIYMSSLAASRPTLCDEVSCETDHSTPVDWYGRSKVLAERNIQAGCTKDWTIVRPVSVYGEGDKDFLQLFKTVKSGINLRIGRQDQKYNMIHVLELCDFLRLCVEKAGARNQVFFASDGNTYSQTEFIAIVAKLLGVKTKDLFIPVWMARMVFHAGDLYERITKKSTMINTQKMKEIIAVNWICSIQKARDLLGWALQPDLEGRLRKTLDWYKQKGWL